MSTPSSAVVLATCRTWPALSVSDRCLAEALAARGWTVTAAPWNGAFTPFQDATAVVLRSCWDYHETPEHYLSWLGRLVPDRTFNRPDLVAWNHSKAYLLDLARRGAPVPRSREAPADATAIAEALAELGLDHGVIKPLVGASGFGVERIRRGSVVGALARAQTGKPTDRVLVQEFVAGVDTGEIAGVFFEGEFSHALRRVPQPGEFRVNTQYGGRMEPTPLASATVDEMSAVLRLLPAPALYARVDGLVSRGRFVLMEVEVNEPALGLHLAPGSADRFADALERRLGRARHAL